jgi:AmmeMemoRadiSam system protein B
MLGGFLGERRPATALGLVVPHAGYMYSGSVAGEVYSLVRIPPRLIILCPNHTGLGPPLSIMRRGRWQTPLGELGIDTELSDALIDSKVGLQEDTQAHKYEHGVEVHLPFLQHLEGDKPRFVPIVVGTSNSEILERLGHAIGSVVALVDRSTLVIASSDMNHYESDAVTRIKDSKAIDEMLKLDAAGLYATVRKSNISMCGLGPAVAMLVAAKSLGSAKATLVKYSTSAEKSGDFERVVGYAGIIVS